MTIFLRYLWEDPRFFLSWVLIVTFSICLHELAHAYTALRCGDDTAAREGHLSLNPMVQMGVSSLVILCLFGIAWGAVPVNVSYLRKRTDAALVAVAGPLANLLLCIAFGLAVVIAGTFLGSDHPVKEFFRFGSLANGVLCLFNMLPVPMFDGWAVFSVFVPAMRTVDVHAAQNIGMVFLLLVFVTPLGSLIWNTGSNLGLLSIEVWSILLGVG